MYLRVHHDHRGFTLLEMLVVIAIILILATAVVADSRPVRRQAEFESVVNDVVSFVQTARQYSVAVREHTAGVYPSYGVYFSTDSAKNNRILMYADCEANDNNLTPIGIDDTFGYVATNCSNDADIETLTLRHGVRVNSIKVTTVNAGGGGETEAVPTNVSVLYLRPEPTVWMSVEDSVGVHTTQRVGWTDVELTDSSGLLTRVIRLNTHGLITTL